MRQRGVESELDVSMPADELEEFPAGQEELDVLGLTQTELEDAIDELRRREAEVASWEAEVSIRFAALEAERQMLVRAGQERAEAGVRLEQLARELREREESLAEVESSAAFRRGELVQLEAEHARRLAELGATGEALHGEREAIVRAEAELDRRRQELRAELEGLAGGRAELASGQRKLREEEALTAARDEQLSKRELELEQTVRELAKQHLTLEEQTRKLAQDTQALGRREERLTSREAEVAARQQMLDLGEAELEERHQALLRGEQERRDPLIAASSARLFPEPNIDAELVKRAASAARNELHGQPSVRWNLHVVDRLVSERRAEFPESIEEWAAYLISLRDVADSAGTLPQALDGLLDEVFEPLASGT